jgi:O-antigen/teichoic acid export membrane protein
VIVGVSTVVAGALGFGMQALLSHRLAPADYGAAFTVMSVLIMILLPTNALALVVAKEASRDEADPRARHDAAIMWAWHRYLMLGGVGIALLGIAGAPWLAQFFNVSPMVLVPAALSVPFGLAIPLLLGHLQGQQHFRTLALLFVGQAAFRLVLLASLAAAFGAVGALAGVALGNMIVYALAFATVNRTRTTRTPTRREWQVSFGSLGVILPSSLALAVLLSADLLLVKHFFSNGEAGRYAAVAALGRTVFWGATGIGLVLFPKAVLHVRRGSSSSHLVLASVAMCVLGGIAAWAAFSFGSGLILSIFAGHAYAAAGPYLPWYVLAMTLFSGASVLIGIGQARGDPDFLAILIPATLLEPLLIVRFHQSLTQVLQVFTLSMAALFIGLAVLYVLQERVRVQPRLMVERATA